MNIISKLRSGLYIWTNEGKDLMAWLGNDRGVAIESIDVDVVNSLFIDGVIVLVDNDLSDSLFKYSLADIYVA